jgi:hypothetical protein
MPMEEWKIMMTKVNEDPQSMKEENQKDELRKMLNENLFQNIVVIHLFYTYLVKLDKNMVTKSKYNIFWTKYNH